MNIKTKSLQKLAKKSDGLCICVMRRIKPEYKFDIWMPVLAPSEELVQQYVIDKKISWREFIPKYKKEIAKKKNLLFSIVDLSKRQKITLLCWEKSAQYCHRSILLTELANVV